MKKIPPESRKRPQLLTFNFTMFAGELYVLCSWTVAGDEGEEREGKQKPLGQRARASLADCG